MNKLLIASLFWIFVMAVGGQPDGGVGVLTGTVVCSDNHLAARGAIVTLRQVPTEEHPSESYVSITNTDLDGSFSVSSLPVGNYEISVSLAGYLDTSASSAPASSILGTGAGISSGFQVTRVEVGNLSSVHIVLQRGGMIDGIVYYPDGSPAINLEVRATLYSTDTSMLAPDVARPSASLHTDACGRYSFSGLSAGRYLIVVLLPEKAGLDRPKFFLGNTENEANAKLVEIRPPEHLYSVDIILSTRLLTSLTNQAKPL